MSPSQYPSRDPPAPQTKQKNGTKGRGLDQPRPAYLVHQNLRAVGVGRRAVLHLPGRHDRDKARVVDDGLESVDGRGWGGAQEGYVADGRLHLWRRVALVRGQVGASDKHCRVGTGQRGEGTAVSSGERHSWQPLR